MNLKPTFFTLDKRPFVDRFQQDFLSSVQVRLPQITVTPRSYSTFYQLIELILPYYFTEVYFHCELIKHKRDAAYVKVVEYIHRLISACQIDPETLLIHPDDMSQVTLYQDVVDEMLAKGATQPYMIGNQPFTIITDYLIDADFKIEGDVIYVYSDLQKIITQMVKLEKRVNQLEEENNKYRSILLPYQDYLTGQVKL